MIINLPCLQSPKDIVENGQQKQEHGNSDEGDSYRSRKNILKQIGDIDQTDHPGNNHCGKKGEARKDRQLDAKYPGAFLIERITIVVHESSRLGVVSFAAGNRPKPGVYLLTRSSTMDTVFSRPSRISDMEMMGNSLLKMM